MTSLPWRASLTTQKKVLRFFKVPFLFKLVPRMSPISELPAPPAQALLDTFQRPTDAPKAHTKPQRLLRLDAYKSFSFRSITIH